ncbi:hypothetical protein CL689_00035 [Candidatus Saccharibacteria bacterium]|nr:hypothetical protein [Candidatus Saccharibacteria bacterium]MBJ58127.1 hypothetical protein [Candidatus Saccharibacteria bacterium]MBQ68442.1 hypothetical protein [Candidatus Saccharibacteria bacterium]|tara:strand:- start:1046 stop:1420 length:375 start_codon:yes stop_codon:yes gene_type:complete
MELAILVWALVIYSCMGLLVYGNGMFFHQPQRNPIQDRIRWIHPIAQAVLWLPLLIAWLTSSTLNRYDPTYRSHEDRMEDIVDRIVADVDRTMPDAGSIDYRIPSPREYREHGTRAFNLEVTLD